MNIERGSFGKLNDGREVTSYKISNSKGEYIKVLDLGGIINELYILDRDGNTQDIVCGYDEPQKYIDSPGYQGALIGRIANRIKDSKFTLDGVTYNLYTNSCGKDCLHGGKIGFDKKFWDVTEFTDDLSAGLILSLVSEDGDEGFPGTLNVTVTYTFTEDSRFSINYLATTDKATPVNLTQHVYFNLNGYDGGSTMDHTLFIDADSYIKQDERQISTDIASVEGTEFDFRTPRKIRIGYDCNFNVTDYCGLIKHRATLESDKTGRRIKLYTNTPAVQLYTGCVMDGDIDFKGGVKQVPLNAVCLETQHYPDTPNRPDFPSCTLRPGEVYDFTAIFEFSTF